MTQIIKETILYMWRSEKNRLFMGLATAFVLIYSIFILPQISGEDEVDLDLLEVEMTGNVVQFENSLDDGLLVPSVMTGTTAYSSLRGEYIMQRELLTALKQGDVERYITIDYRPGVRESSTEKGLEQMVFNVFAYEAEQPYQRAKNQFYASEVDELSFHTVHDRTSLQQVHLFALGLGPVILLIGLIFLISDVHVKDRGLETQKLGIPVKWQTYLFVQALTALAFVTVFYLALLGVFTLVNGLQYGFGSLDLPIGFHEAFFDDGYFNLANYQTQTIGWFLLKSVPFVLLLGYLFTRLNTLLSLWTRQSVVTMVIGIFMILFQFIYYGRDSAELAGIDITYFPQTYIDFGNIITGRFEFQIFEAIPELYSRGLIVLAGSILALELLIFLSSKRITRQRFVS